MVVEEDVEVRRDADLGRYLLRMSPVRVSSSYLFFLMVLDDPIRYMMFYFLLDRIDCLTPSLFHVRLLSMC